MSPWPILLLLLLFYLPNVCPLFCLDGTDCRGLSNCAVCDGSLCLRITKPHPKRGWSTAMTCIPDSHLSYYPEGCRTSQAVRETVCVCSHSDLCNSSPHSPFILLIPLLLLLLR